MRIVFGVILVLTTAITIWLMTLNSPSPDFDAIQPSTSAELSGHAENFSEDDAAQPQSVTPTDANEHNDLSLVEQALLRYPSVSKQAQQKRTVGEAAAYIGFNAGAVKRKSYKL